MATITANTGSNNWNTNTAWVGGVQPTAASDVVIPASAIVTIPTAITALGRSLTVQASGTLAFATTTSVLTLGDATAGAGNVALSVSGTATITLTGLGTINFVSTNATQQTITTNGKTMPNLTFNGAGGSWILSDNLTATNSLITVAAGTFNTGGAKTHTFGNFATSGAGTKVCTFTNTTINGLNVVQPWTIAGSGLTLTMTSSTLNCSIGSGTFTGGAFTYGTLNFTAITTIVAIGASSTFVNLSATGATKNIQLRFNTAGAGAATVTGTLTLGGSTTQGVNRLQVFGITPGNAAQVNCTGAAVVINGDVAFMDVSLTGSPSWTNAGSAFVGDCLGNNSLITTNRTTPATQTWSGTTGGNWSANAWTSRVPLPQDNVIIASAFSANQTITADMPLMGADIDFTGTTGTNLTLQRGASISPALFGSLTLVPLTMLTTTGNWVLSGRSTHTLTSNGATWSFTTGQLVFSGPGGTYTLGDALTITGILTISDGTFTTNNFAVTCDSINASSARTTTVNLGTSTLTLTSAAGGGWSTSAVATTVNASTATVVFSGASATARAFSLGANSNNIGTVTYTVANSPGSLSFGTTGGNPTIGTLNIGSGRQVIFGSTKTYTITNWNVNGAVNGYIKLPGVAANYFSAPATADSNLIDARCKVALVTWGSAARDSFVARWQSTTVWALTTLSTNFRVDWFDSGGVTHALQVAIPVSFVNGTARWIRATLDASTTTHTVKFYESSDGSSWSQIGATQTIAALPIGLRTSTDQVSVGAITAGAALPSNGNFYRAQIRNNILDDGTGIVFDADFTTKTVGANSVIDASGNTIYYTGGALKLPGVSGQNASSPDSTALSITGNIDLISRIAAASYTPASNQSPFGKQLAVTAAQGGYGITIVSTGVLRLFWTNSAGTPLAADSTVATGAADGSILWVRATMNVNNGSGSRLIKFYTSTTATNDPTAVVWTQLGSTVTVASTTNITDGGSVLEIGTITGGTANLFIGSIYRATIKNGYDGAGSTVFDADFTTTTAQIFNEGANAAQVTVNGAVTINGTPAQAGDGRVAITATTAGSAGTLASATHVASDYLTVQDNIGSGSTPFFAGVHGVLVSGNTNWVATGPVLTISTKSLTLTTFAPVPSVSVNRRAIPGVINLALTTFAPTVSRTTNILSTPSTKSLVLTTYAPQASATNNITFVPGKATLAIRSFAPLVSRTLNEISRPGPLALTIAVYSPTVTASLKVIIVPGVAVLSTGSFAPQALVSDNKRFVPGFVALVIASFAPSISLSDNKRAVPTPGVLATTGFGPVLAITQNALARPQLASLALTSYVPRARVNPWHNDASQSWQGSNSTSWQSDSPNGWQESAPAPWHSDDSGEWYTKD